MKSLAQLETDRQGMAAQFEYGYANGKKDADAELKAINADLLQALEDIATHADHAVGHGVPSMALESIRDKARAAIAKAKP